MKKIWLWLIPSMIALSLILTLRWVVQPALEIWALATVQSYVSQNTPFELAADNLNLSWIPLKATADNLRLRAKNPEVLGFDVLKLKNIDARPDLLMLLTGRLGLSSVWLEGLDLDLNLDPHLKGSGATPDIPWKTIFALLEKIPVKTLGILNNHVHLSSKELNFEVNIVDLAARAYNLPQKLSLELQTGKSEMRFRDLSSPWTLTFDGFVTPQSIEVSRLDLNTVKQSLALSGVFTEIHQLLKEPHARLQLKAKNNLEEIAALFPPSWHLPQLRGDLELDSTLEIRGQKIPIGQFRLSTKDIWIAQSEVGSLETQGQFDGRILTMAKVIVTHGGGHGLIEDIKGEFGTDKNDPHPFDHLSIKAKVSTQDLSLHDLLKNVGVGDLPLDLKILGAVDCAGPILPKPNVVCVGSAQGKDLEVHLEEKGKILPLVALKAFSVEGGVQITDEAVTYQARAQVGNDKGSSDGLISYSKGFLIHYETPGVHLDHVGSIAQLKVEGLAAIQGSTQGDSEAATFELKAKGENIYFEDFYLGKAETQVRYEKGHLTFTGLKGTINTSPYTADVDADLVHSRLAVTGQSTQLKIEDLFAVFPRKFIPPVTMTGLANVKATVEGPFELGQLSYNLSAQVPQLNVAGEGFRDGEIVIVSKDGEVHSEKAQFRKGSQWVQIQGVGHPNGHVDIHLAGNQLLLEESENVMQMGSNISGFLDLGVQVRGFILDPDVLIQSQLGQMIIEDQEFPPSAASLQVNLRRMDGSVRLFSGRLYGDFTIPFTDAAPFRLKLQASDWNFATLATLIGGGSLLSEYESALTGDLNLSSERGGLWTATGQGTIQNFILRRGQQTLRNRQPMKLVMTNGSGTLENFRVEGGDDYVDVSASQVSRDQLRMKIDGELSLRILQIFVPFLEELGGQGRINANVTGKLLKPEILGSAHLSEGFARLKGFPHALERFSADAQFSASRIVISDIKGSLAGGTVKGEGSVLLNGPRDIPVNIHAIAEGITLNVPDKVQTTGDADLTFSGNWFPFVLAGTYRVYGGLFSKELEDSSSSQQVQQSTYLPKIIRESSFEPVLLDIKADLIRPMQLKNSMIEGQATGNITVRGNPKSPSLLGLVNIASGSKVTYRDKIFDLNSAALKFTDSKEINPELFVSARARVNEYDISLMVQGTAKDPLVQMSSTPPLPQNDIVTLLALGVTSQKLEKQIQTREQENSTQNELIGILTQISPAKSIQKQLGVNLQISSSYDDTKNIAIQKITLSRQISARINAAVSQSRGEQNSTEAKVQYFFNPNLSAVGSWEGREATEGTTVNTQESKSESIFGIDLEFKKEFK